MRSGVYFILNKISLKLYIGSATYFTRRRSEHFTRLSKNCHHNEHLQRAYNKYGIDAFDFIIIELVALNNLLERETYYISRHRATEEEFGYNKCEVGSGMTGRKHSEATKEKMRIKRFGTKHSAATKSKIAEIVKGRKNDYPKQRKSRLEPLILTSTPIMIGK